MSAQSFLRAENICRHCDLGKYHILTLHSLWKSLKNDFNELDILLARISECAVVNPLMLR